MSDIKFDPKNTIFEPGKTRIKYGGAYTDQSDLDAIWSVLKRNWWTIDKEGEAFEKELSEFTGVKHVALTNSGSSALMVAYASLGLPEGSEVITGAVQFPTAISSLYYNHLTPVFVDVEPNNFSVNPDLVEAAITEKTKAILAVAVAGNIPNIPRLREIANKHNLILILDNCDGFASTYNSKPIEQYFDIAATSFHAAHILNCGEGGAVFASNDAWGEKALSLREWGRLGGYDNIDSKYDLEGIPSDYPARYLFVHMGFNVKPLEFQCAMGRTQLKKAPLIKKMRQDNFNILFNGLKELQDDGHVVLPQVHDGCECSWFSFPFIANRRGELREFLEARNIETRTIFGGNITKQPAFRNFGRIVGNLTFSDVVMNAGMFVSVHPDTTPEMAQYIVDSIKEFYA